MVSQAMKFQSVLRSHFRTDTRTELGGSPSPRYIKYGNKTDLNTIESDEDWHLLAHLDKE